MQLPGKVDIRGIAVDPSLLHSAQHGTRAQIMPLGRRSQTRAGSMNQRIGELATNDGG